MNTTFVPSVSSTLNNENYSVYVGTDLVGNGIMGSSNAGYTNVSYINPRTNVTNNAILYLQGLSQDQISNLNAKGFYQINTIAAGSFDTFKNSTKIGTKIRTATGLTTASVYLGAFNGSGANEYSPNEISFSSISDGLTDTQAAYLYTAVQAFQTSLSRQV